MFSLRYRRNVEEINEYVSAVGETAEAMDPLDHERTIQGLADMLDALVDQVYIALGTAYLHGFNFNEAWRRVHEANMKKARVSSAVESRHGSAYDIVKPEGWTAPDHTDLVKHYKPFR